MVAWHRLIDSDLRCVIQYSVNLIVESFVVVLARLRINTLAAADTKKTMHNLSHDFSIFKNFC